MVLYCRAYFLIRDVKDHGTQSIMIMNYKETGAKPVPAIQARDRGHQNRAPTTTVMAHPDNTTKYQRELKPRD
jgi:hypothetical protein